MEIKEQEKEAPMREFMKVSLDGFPWAENICQRVESICAENNMVQNPGKYVNVVGEHFRKVIDTVVNDLCEHADDVLELFSELSFGHASMIKASARKGEELDGHRLHNKPSTCKCEEHDTAPIVMENMGAGFENNTTDETFLTSEHADDVLELFSELSIGHASLIKATARKDEELDGHSLHNKPSTCICEERDTAPIVMENTGAGFGKNTSDETFLKSGKLDRASSIKDSLSEYGDRVMVHEILNTEIEDNADTEILACVKLAPEVHPVGVLNQLQLPSEPQFLNKEEVVSNGILLETPNFGPERSNCSAKSLSDAPSLVVDITASASLCEANSSAIHQGKQTGGPSPFNSIYILDIESEVSSHLLESDGSELGTNGPKGRENHMKYENLNSCSMEEFGNSSIFSLKNEDFSEFEDVKLEDDFRAVKAEKDWDDIVKTEIALISSLAAKKESSKIKLKKMFTSRWRPSSRSRKPVASLEDLHSKKNPSDFDWELL